MKRSFDICVVGSGLVGSAFSLALAQAAKTQQCHQPLRIAVLERVPQASIEKVTGIINNNHNDNNGNNKNPSSSSSSSSSAAIVAIPPPDLRVSALSWGSVCFLHSLGIWEDIVSKYNRAGLFTDMHLWHSSSLSSLSHIHIDSSQERYAKVFDRLNINAPSSLFPNQHRQFGVAFANDSGNTINSNINVNDIGIDRRALGFVVENRLISSLLWHKLAEDCKENVELLTGPDNSLVKLDLKSMTADLSNGDVISAKLFVGADGPASLIRKLAGIPTFGWDYNRKAIVSTVEVNSNFSTTAFQCFHPNGPVALLPLPSPYNSIVWSTTPEEADHLLSLSNDEFVKNLNNSLISHDASVTVPEIIKTVGPRAAFDLRLNHAVNYVKPGLALIGDAAHQVHPMAGQGANLGFGDAVELAAQIINNIDHGLAVNDYGSLLRYEKARKHTNLKVTAGVDLLHRVFALSNNADRGTLNHSSNNHDSSNTNISHICSDIFNSVRSLGMSFVDKSPLVKEAIVYSAASKETIDTINSGIFTKKNQ